MTFLFLYIVTLSAPLYNTTFGDRRQYRRYLNPRGVNHTSKTQNLPKRTRKNLVKLSWPKSRSSGIYVEKDFKGVFDNMPSMNSFILFTFQEGQVTIMFDIWDLTEKNLGKKKHSFDVFGSSHWLDHKLFWFEPKLFAEWDAFV